jgi:metal-responsive CopG/Arc/MetJ family transcriptional regulator
VVAVTLEKGLLARVDAYARKHRMKRAQMITQGLRIVMGESAA